MIVSITDPEVNTDLSFVNATAARIVHLGSLAGLAHVDYCRHTLAFSNKQYITVYNALLNQTSETGSFRATQNELDHSTTLREDISEEYIEHIVSFYKEHGGFPLSFTKYVCSLRSAKRMQPFKLLNAITRVFEECAKFTTLPENINNLIEAMAAHTELNKSGVRHVVNKMVTNLS